MSRSDESPVEGSHQLYSVLPGQTYGNLNCESCENDTSNQHDISVTFTTANNSIAGSIAEYVWVHGWHLD